MTKEYPALPSSSTGCPKIGIAINSSTTVALLPKGHMSTSEIALPEGIDVRIAEGKG